MIDLNDGEFSIVRDGNKLTIKCHGVHNNDMDTKYSDNVFVLALVQKIETLEGDIEDKDFELMCVKDELEALEIVSNNYRYHISEKRGKK